ncbi:response regulator [Brevundimonas sp. TWP2-3-4b2]|uniref:response regulator n=1 Tax=Brevundimonas sp. TWP2-3-4b2 TaxID=2804595 RepID=UPI003CF164AB
MGALNVLHVEDDESIRALTELIFSLAADGIVRTAASGEEALAALKSGYKPDVILLDVMMPGLDGPTVLALLREMPLHSSTPVIFMTARAHARQRDRLLSLGAIGVITKPFDPTTLAAEIRGYLAGARP